MLMRDSAAVATDTRARLIAGALASLRDNGIAGTSARAIAAAAGVNQALVFYHFKSVAELIDIACRESAAARVDVYRDRFAQVSSLSELLELGRDLHVTESQAGNVAVLAQVLAGAQQDDVLAGAAAGALALWTAEIEATLIRVLAGSPVASVVDAPGMARAITASFIGIELYDGVDPDGAASALTAIDALGVLVDVVDDLGPVARTALRKRLRRTTKKRP